MVDRLVVEFFMPGTRILHAADLHGNNLLYQQLLALARDSVADMIVLGGDLLPTVHSAGRYDEMVLNQESFIRSFLLPFFKECLNTTAVKHILLIAGNWDLAYPTLFNEQIKGVIDLNQKLYPLDNGYELIGYPFVPPTPFWPKDYEKMDDPEAPWPPQKSTSYIRSPDPDSPLREIDPYLFLRQRGTIREDLSQLPRPGNLPRAIYVMHSPPYGTNLDRIAGNHSVGSHSIRAFIETYQPLLTLHGHIHESPEISGNYLDRIGKTLCINPGQPFREGGGFRQLQAVTLEMENPGETIIHTSLAKRR
jgi:Icc-related predicted phosphoesterase